jgi:hypothetical protein
MFTCPNGNVFLGVIDTIGEHKDAQVLHINVLIGYIETIGVDNIIQICTNNISNMQNVTNLLICHFSNLYFQGCALFGLVTRRLKGKNMGETNGEKGESYCFFHMATPCTTCNLLSLQNQLNASKPH